MTTSVEPGLPAPGFRSNLLRRVLTAVVVLPVLVAALFLGPRVLGISIVAVALFLGLLEFYGLLRARDLRPVTVVGFLIAGFVFLGVVHPGGSAPFWPLAAVLLLVPLLARGDLAQTAPAAAGTLLGAVYLGALGGSMAALLALEPEAEGAWRIVLLLAIVMVSDTFAFFVGHAVGRHRLAPAISPGKTVEGALGGLAGGVLAALVVRRLGLPQVPLVHAVLLGLGVAVLGILGDLCESLLKRWAGVKDSGRLFPGHGGMLDRIDSLLFGAPVLYYYFLYVP